MIGAILVALFFGVAYLVNFYITKSKQQKAIQKYSFINNANFFENFKFIDNVEIQKQLISRIEDVNEKVVKSAGLFSKYDKIEFKDLISELGEYHDIYWHIIVNSIEDDEFPVYINLLENIKDDGKTTQNLRILLENLIIVWNKIFDYYEKHFDKKDVKIRMYLELFKLLKENNFLQKK